MPQGTGLGAAFAEQNQVGYAMEQLPPPAPPAAVRRTLTEQTQAVRNALQRAQCSLDLMSLDRQPGQKITPASGHCSHEYEKALRYEAGHQGSGR